MRAVLAADCFLLFLVAPMKLGSVWRVPRHEDGSMQRLKEEKQTKKKSGPKARPRLSVFVRLSLGLPRDPNTLFGGTESRPDTAQQTLQKRYRDAPPRHVITLTHHHSSIVPSYISDGCP